MGARRGTDDPVWYLGVDKGSGLLPILSLREVPRVAVGLEGSHVEGVQSLDIDVERPYTLISVAVGVR